MHTTKILAISLLLSAGTCSADNFIGQIIPPYSTGWEDEGGWCLDSECRYNIGVLNKANQRVLYFGKTAPSNDKLPHWLVVDQMPYPEIPANFELASAACEINGKSDLSIIAVVKSTDTEWHNQVRFAYKANTATLQFETISTKGIRCQNNAWGL